MLRRSLGVAAVAGVVALVTTYPRPTQAYKCLSSWDYRLERVERVRLETTVDLTVAPPLPWDLEERLRTSCSDGDSYTFDALVIETTAP